MRWNTIAIFVMTTLLTACHGIKPKPATPPGKLQAFQASAGKFNSVITVPVFETTTNEIQATASQTIAAGNAALDRIGQLTTAEVSFRNTVVALDDMGSQMGLAANRLSLIEQTSTNAGVREVATVALKQLAEWSVGIDYREDVYRALKAFAATQPQLSGEDKKLFDETLRDYRRAGLELPKADRDEVERMRKELSSLATDFDNNVTKAE